MCISSLAHLLLASHAGPGVPHPSSCCTWLWDMSAEVVCRTQWQTRTLRKLCHTNNFCMTYRLCIVRYILIVMLSLMMHHMWGFRCSPSPKHTAKWLAVIADSMANDRMCPGTASKLAGALSWGAQNMFFRQALAFTMFMFALVCVCCVRFGRAMLRPLFTQQYGRSSTINEPLRLALAWWQEVLQLQIADTKEWYAQQQQVQPKPPPLIPTM